MNFQQLGDASAANKAIGVELQATETHLQKAWRSNESYYREKYRGWSRASSLIAWLGFKALDFMWGNGESLLKLCRFIVLVLVLMAIFEVFMSHDPMRVDSYLHAFASTPAIFLGVLAPNHDPRWYITFVTFVRLVAMGFFLSIMVKRFNRR